MGHFISPVTGRRYGMWENKICGATDIELTEKDISRHGNWGKRFLKKTCISMRSSAPR